MKEIKLNREEVLRKLSKPPPEGSWLIAVDPELLVAKILFQDPDGFVADVEGHEDLFPLRMAFERNDAILKGGDWLVARTPDRREHDGIYRSYKITWIEVREPVTRLAHPSALRIFLCHSSADKDRVRAFYRDLKEQGFQPWLDEDNLLPGQEWRLEIRKAIRTCDAFVICISSSSVTRRGFAQAEITFALDVAEEQPEGSIFIIPVRFDDCEVPERLRRWHSLDYFVDSGRDRLFRAFRARAAQLEHEYE